MGLQIGDIADNPLPRWPRLLGGPLLQTLEAGPLPPGLLPFVLKDMVQGQALGRGLGCPLSRGWASTVFSAFTLPL